MLTAQDYYAQSALTAHGWLAKALRSIDELFNEPGYAKAHPELVGAFMQTCAIEFHASFGLQTLSASIDGVRDTLAE
jgi:hypothetical protein